MVTTTWTFRGCRIRAAVPSVLLVGTLLVPPGARAQEVASAGEGTTTLRALAGDWTGEGELMGRPARFAMCWDEVLAGAFMRLTFANHFTAPEGDQPVLQATGYYPTAAGATGGTWVDSRGVVFDLRVEEGPSSVVVVWTGEEEEGRTTYEMTSDSTLVSRDEVRAEGGYRLFAMGTLRRADVPACEKGATP